ncbi:MAG: glycosyltransferase family 2 protein [Deltaproteobacteria bacterium]|nr:glycosyltransferase family 2 protein [Deltaproteobacteria bacterium]
MKDLSVVIPSFNGREHLGRTIEDLLDIAPDAEVIVVDGGSTDGSQGFVRKTFPGVALLEVRNHGFSHATNRGIEATTRPLVLFLNSDLFINRRALETMAAALRRDVTLGAVGPYLFNEDGSRQQHFTWLYWPRYVPSLTGPLEVPRLCAACIMTRRDVLEDVGCLDESFFLYNEEFDWCERVSVGGYGVQLLPVGATHVGGGSTVPSPDLTLERYRGFLYMLGKHRPWIQRPVRRSMQLKGWFLKRFDPKPEWRALWGRVYAMTTAEDYRHSPFALSGRGVVALEPLPPAGSPSVARSAASQEAQAAE